MTHVTLETDGALAIVTLDNPPQNRIGDQMADELAGIVEAIESGESRAVLLRAKGTDFSFGGDIMNWPEMSPRRLRATFDRYMSLFNRFERLPLPVITAVQGLCFGGGLELATRADIIVAGESARFGHPEQSLGIVTVLGGVYRVAERAGRAFASEWALTSQQVPPRR
jgi:enoyl-CoA hydratase/carnithine racemase